MPNYSPPPYRIKMVEPIRRISRNEREKALKKAYNNLFLLPSEAVYIDLLTDSGTGAMSHFQWSALMRGDEAYAGSRSFYRLEETVRNITAYQYVIPVHQGRGAEQVLLPILAERRGMYYISNTHFDTTRAHVELSGARALDCVIPECFDIQTYHPFKGNMDVKACKGLIEKYKPENIAGIIMTLTNNSAGGQPVSLENLRMVRDLARQYNIPLIMDGARFAENAAFIRQREAGYEQTAIRDIAAQMFDCCDIFLMSAKKDGLVNIGGLIVIRDDEALFEKCRVRTVAYEGFPTYGGLAGRDLEAMAVGLKESLDLDYLNHRLDQVRYLAESLHRNGIPVQYPPGGHAVFVECREICPHIPYDHFPAQAVCNALYLESGVRGVEVGSLLMGRDPESGENIKSPFEWMRLSIPRRTYEYAHLDIVSEGVLAVWEKRESLKGLIFEYEPPVLRHFTAKMKYE